MSAPRSAPFLRAPLIRAWPARCGFACVLGAGLALTGCVSDDEKAEIKKMVTDEAIRAARAEIEAAKWQLNDDMKREVRNQLQAEIAAWRAQVARQQAAAASAAAAAGTPPRGAGTTRPTSTPGTGTTRPAGAAGTPPRTGGTAPTGAGTAPRRPN